MTLPPKRPMPGKSFAPATSRVCAPAPVGARNSNASSRCGVNILRAGTIGNLCILLKGKRGAVRGFRLDTARMLRRQGMDRQIIRDYDDLRCGPVQSARDKRLGFALGFDGRSDGSSLIQGLQSILDYKLKLRDSNRLDCSRSGSTTMDYSKICFVIMPFGPKPVGDQMVDFDPLYDDIFAPAISAVALPEGGKLEPRRTDKDFFAGD